MPSQIYNWKRFWCPRSGSFNLSDGGYLYDPDAEWGKAYNPDLVTFKTISHLPCLALLGEPGIGKTEALKAERSEIVSKVQEQGNQILFLDLRSHGSEDRLVRYLFDSRDFTAWQAGTHQLHIFLDSFDECLLRVDTLATLLVDEFKRYQDIVNRLCLRIACRTAVWPEVLEEGLIEIFGENSVGVYELVPLRRADVIESARAEGFSPDDFLKEVGQKNIVPLAIKPVTLGFLLNIYRRHNGQFPPNQRLHELYLEGCKLLCQEVSKSRWGSNRRGNLDIDRLIVAARIAAITIFANRSAVWTGIDQGNRPDEDVLLQELCRGSENANGREFEITRVVIEEVLDTGLFSSCGLYRMGWAHQTYTEFLAALYLVQHEIPLAQIIELIFLSESSDKKLIPQLHETAAWLSSMRMDVFQEIMKTDPDVLLGSDIPTDPNLREAIVNSLLIQYEQGKLYGYDRKSYQSYGKLKHPGLVTQLRPYIQDSTKHDEAREVAIDIAEVCKVFELQEELVNLALGSSQPIYLRVSAAKAVCSIGNEGTRLRLKPLAIEPLSEDEDDRLKGYALQAVWSDNLTVEELFQALTPPKKRNYSASYQMFLNYIMVSQLQPYDLVVALDWLTTQGIRCFGHPFEELGDKILLKAWEHFNFPGIAERFAKIAVIQWKEYQNIITRDPENQTQFASSFTNNTPKRRKLIEQIVSIALNSEEEQSHLLGNLKRTMHLREDVSWMLEKLQKTDSEKVQCIWSQLIYRNFNPQNAKEVDAIIVATQANDVLRREFVPYIEAIDLNSTLAERMKSDYLEMQEWEEHDKFSPLEPLPKERVLHCLEQLELGNLLAWWQLNMEMTLKPESTHYDNEFELDITKLPGWQEAEKSTQTRIIEGAKKYIQEQNDIAYEWIGTNTFDRPSLAGCRALQLLLKESSDFLENLSLEIWEKWTPIIIAVSSSNQHEGSYLEIVKRAYLNAPQKFINTAIALIDKEIQKSDSISVINRFGKCWDKRLKLALLEKAKDPALKPKGVGQLLEELLKQELTEARDFAKSLISFPLPLAENEREKILIASRVLVENSDSSSWSFIWSLIQQDSSFGREVLELAAYRYSFGFQLNLTETQLADLYVWLVCQYPYDEDPDYSLEVLAHSVTVRDSMARLKHGVLCQLMEQGTLQACAEIQRLIQELPDITWLPKTLIDAQANRRRKTWQARQPEQILQLASSQLKNRSTHIQTGVLIMQGSNNPNFHFGGSVGGVNVNSTVHGNQIGTQHNYASEQNLLEACDEIQQIFARLTQNYPTSTESEQQIVVAEAVKEVKQNPTLMKRMKAGGQAFIFEALQKVSDQWWVSPFVKAVEAGIKGE